MALSQFTNISKSHVQKHILHSGHDRHTRVPKHDLTSGKEHNNTDDLMNKHTTENQLTIHVLGQHSNVLKITEAHSDKVPNMELTTECQDYLTNKHAQHTTKHTSKSAQPLSSHAGTYYYSAWPGPWKSLRHNKNQTNSEENISISEKSKRL